MLSTSKSSDEATGNPGIETHRWMIEHFPLLQERMHQSQRRQEMWWMRWTSLLNDKNTVPYDASKGYAEWVKVFTNVLFEYSFRLWAASIAFMIGFSNDICHINLTATNPRRRHRRTRHLNITHYSSLFAFYRRGESADGAPRNDIRPSDRYCLLLPDNNQLHHAGRHDIFTHQTGGDATHFLSQDLLKDCGTIDIDDRY